MSDYNGWKNRSTWNIALTINNVEPVYRSAVDFMSTYKGAAPYQDFVDAFGFISTPEGVRFDSEYLCIEELNSMMRELVE